MADPVDERDQAGVVKWLDAVTEVWALRSDSSDMKYDQSSAGTT